MQVPRAAPSEVISTFSSGWWDLNLHPASWPFLQGRRDLGRGCHWPLWKLLPLPGQPECLRRDPASCFQLASCEQWGLCHSSLMKLSIETRATWKAHGAQALVVLCHGIHQFKSNSRILNTWIRISLAKCFTQRLLAKKGWVGLWTAGQTVMTTNPKWSKTCHQPRLVASLSEALNYTEKKVFLLAGFISPQAGMLPWCSFHLQCQASTHAFQQAQKSKTSLWILYSSLWPFSRCAPNTPQKFYLHNAIYDSYWIW